MIDPATLIPRSLVAARSRQWVVVGAMWAVSLLGWSAVALLPDIYDSTARVYMDTGAILTPLLKGLAVDDSAGSDLEVLQRTLLSRPAVDKLMMKVGYDARERGYGTHRDLADALVGRIRIVAQPQARNLFSIGFADANPYLARDVVQATVTLLIETATGTLGDDMANASTFLAGQIETYERKLRLAEQARAAFLVRYADVLPGVSGLSRLDGARAQAEVLAGRVTDAKARVSLLQSQLAGTSQSLGRAGPSIASSNVQASDAAVIDARQRLADLLLEYTDAHPDVVSARARLSRLLSSTSRPRQPALIPSDPAIPNPIYAQLFVKLVDAQADVTELTRQEADARHQAERLADVVHHEPNLLAQLTSLTRDYDVLRHDYEELLVRRESMRIGTAADEIADKVKLRIVDPPDLPERPTGPHRLLLHAAVGFLGLAVGAGVVALRVWTDRTFFREQELRRLGFRVYGSVGLVPNAALMDQIPRAVLMGSAALLLAMTAVIAVSGAHAGVR